MIKNKILQNDKDFLVEVVDWRGQQALKKTLKPSAVAKRRNRFQNEVYGTQFFADLAKKTPKTGIYPTQLLESGDDYFIREYIDAEPIGDEKSRLDILAKTLAEIDRIEPYGEVKYVGSWDYRDIRKNFNEWLEQPLAKRQISQAQVDQANSILDGLTPYLQPRIAHGDLSSYKHAYLMSEGKVGFIDLEAFTPNAARYYDVARCYCRLYSFAQSTDAAKHFLASFVNSAESVEHQDEQLLAILLQRTIGMQHDAINDAKKGIDYRNRASELLDLVLQNKLELLLT